MLFVSVEDFLLQTGAISRLTRAREKTLAQCMVEGDEAARKMLVHSYLPMVAAYIRRAPRCIRTLRTVYACIAQVEKGVDTFNFQQEGETFTHHLGWRLRQCITRCIADRL